MWNSWNIFFDLQLSGIKSVVAEKNQKNVILTIDLAIVLVSLQLNILDIKCYYCD